MDVSSEATPRFVPVLCHKRIPVLQVDVAEPELTNSRTLGSFLEFRCPRLVERTLELWNQRLTAKEKSLLKDYTQRVEPDKATPSQKCGLIISLRSSADPFLNLLKR